MLPERLWGSEFLSLIEKKVEKSQNECRRSNQIIKLVKKI